MAKNRNLSNLLDENRLLTSNGVVTTNNITVANSSSNNIVFRNQGQIDIGNTSINTSINATGFSINGVSVTGMITGNASTAYSNAVTVAASDATTKAGTAYSNAIAIAANATNITSGTLATARLPATVNVSSAINIGSNVLVNTTSFAIGNSTVNTITNATNISLSSNLIINSTAIFFGNTTTNTTINSTSFTLLSNVNFTNTIFRANNITLGGREIYVSNSNGRFISTLTVNANELNLVNRRINNKSGTVIQLSTDSSTVIQLAGSTDSANLQNTPMTLVVTGSYYSIAFGPTANGATTSRIYTIRYYTLNYNVVTGSFTNSLLANVQYNEDATNFPTSKIAVTSNTSGHWLVFNNRTTPAANSTTYWDYHIDFPTSSY